MIQCFLLKLAQTRNCSSKDRTHIYDKVHPLTIVLIGGSVSKYQSWEFNKKKLKRIHHEC